MKPFTYPWSIGIEKKSAARNRTKNDDTSIRKDDDDDSGGNNDDESGSDKEENDKHPKGGRFYHRCLFYGVITSLFCREHIFKRTNLGHYK